MSLEPFNKTTVADMADRAAAEIEQQRAHIANLAPRAEAFAAIQQILGLLPHNNQGYGEDIAWKLRSRAKQLRDETNDL